MCVRPKGHLPPNPVRSKYFRKERKRPFTKFWMWLFIIFATQTACALKIISQKKYYYIAKDSNVTLDCEFSLASESSHYMEIEWNIVPPNREEDDKIIIWLTGGVLYNDLYDPLKDRAHFTSPDPQSGDASLTIHDLRLTDTGTYQCKVKKLPGIDIKNIILTVMERPSKPVCHMEGEARAGKRVLLKCRSSKGTPPLRYRWSKTSGNQMLPRDAVIDAIGGTLYLPKITERDCGTYLCTVESHVSKEDCEVTFSITSPQTTSYDLKVMAAAVPTVVVVIIAVLTVICFCRRKKTNEEFSSSEILEDELSPREWRRRVQGSAQKVDKGFKKKDKEMWQEDKVIEEEDRTTPMRHESMDRRFVSGDTDTDFKTIEKELRHLVVSQKVDKGFKKKDKEMWREDNVIEEEDLEVCSTQEEKSRPGSMKMM